ncbi:MAG TPA: V-type ATP synthase subunit D [Steroidobacteraceae bacterium]|nr:V-type ATP synthase subunit D [Steroidobacteraceae bacterium]
MAEREVSTTRIALLELKDEQQLVREGYRLLDEKRIVLAGEIRRELERWRGRRMEMRSAEDAVRATLVAALMKHGLDDLAVHAPPLSLADATLRLSYSKFLGLQMINARLEEADTHREPPSAEGASEEVRNCARAHQTLLVCAVAFAACCLRLRRLMREYVRTERRARAIENILLPEINAAVKLLEEQLDGLDQEEFARLRHQRQAAAGAAHATRGAELSP